jgi:hypothetical protein
MVILSVLIEYRNDQNHTREIPVFNTLDEAETWVQNRIDQEPALNQTQRMQLKEQVNAKALERRQQWSTIVNSSQPLPSVTGTPPLPMGNIIGFVTYAQYVIGWFAIA